MTAVSQAGFTLERDSFGRLVLRRADGQVFVGVVPVRAFPIDAPHEGLAMVATDGREALWIDRLAELPPAARQLIEQELATREFVPRILRVLSVSTFSTPSRWQVETDRGETTLVLQGEEDIRRLTRKRLLIAAEGGVQFHVEDLSALDRHSRRLLERFL